MSKSKELGKVEVEPSPLERALTIYHGIVSSRERFEVARFLAESKSPLTNSKIRAQLRSYGLSTSPSTLSHILHEFMQDGYVTVHKRNKDVAADAAEYVKYVVETVGELESKIASSKVAEEIDLVRGEIKDETQLKELAQALTKGSYEESLAQALAAYGSLTASKPRFALVETIMESDRRLRCMPFNTFKELRQRSKLPGSTLSNVLSEFGTHGLVKKVSDAEFAVTEIGIYAAKSVNRLANMLVTSEISQKLKVAEEGGATHASLVAYTAALNKIYGLTK